MLMTSNGVPRRDHQPLSMAEQYLASGAE